MHGETVTRIRPGTSTGNDRYGNPIPGDPDEVDIAGGLFDPGGSSEPIEPGRSAVITEPTLYFLRSWPDFKASDRVEVRGDVFEVVGDPADWRNDAFGGLVVRLRAVGEGGRVDGGS